MCCSEDSMELLTVWYEIECELQVLDETNEEYREAA